MSFDLVAVGGATVDLFLLIDPQNPHVKFNKELNELSLRLGDKVVLESSKLTVGGNANNIAVGLKRLGFNTALMAEVGNDEFYHHIIDNLKKEGVPVSLIKKTNSPTSFSIVLNYHEDRTIFTRKVERKHDFSFKNLETEWFYLTSLGKEWEHIYKKVEALTQKKNIKLAFNPGPSQLDAGLSSFSYLLPMCEVLIVNKEEAEEILNIKNQKSNMKDLLFSLKKLGPRVVVITDGINGSYALDEKANFYSKEALNVRIVSRTGAGDAYSSAFLAAIMSGKKIEDAMEWGTKNAASVIKLIGAQAGLLGRKDIDG